MKYKRLRITNYRGVESSEIEFESRGLTLVQGPNEVGKTSLGEAIGILFEFPDSSKHSAVVAVPPFVDVATVIPTQQSESQCLRVLAFCCVYARP